MKIKPITSAVFCCLFIAETSAQSAILHSLNDFNGIEVGVSRQGLTRITVKDDRILNVFGITGEYVLETDEDQGQVFIRPLGPGTLNPISLTLTTEKGCTQDLRLIPKDKAPEALILQADSTEKETKLAQTLPSREEVEELLYACQAGRIPVGYILKPLDLKTLQQPYRLMRDIRNDPLREVPLNGFPLKGFPLRGLTYEVKNTSNLPWILSESSFAEKLNEDVIAILMPQKLLKPGESTHVYIVEKAIR